MDQAASSLLRLAAHDVVVELLPDIGGRLHRLQFAGHDLLRTPVDLDMHRREPFFWGAYTMAPWCNRVSSGSYMVGERLVNLAPNFSDGTAIHGQVYDRPWQVISDGLLRIRAGGDGWPWPYEVELEVAVAQGTLTIRQRLLNLADEPMPAGFGLHPWFRRPASVAIQADLVYPTNTDSPAQPDPVVGALDLRRRAPMADGLDATWTGLSDPPVEISFTGLAVRATIRADAPTLHITAASPALLDAIAIEPQTHAPQGLRRLANGEPGAPNWLAPGAQLRQDIRINFEQEPDERDGG